MTLILGHYKMFSIAVVGNIVNKFSPLKCDFKKEIYILEKRWWDRGVLERR